MKKCAQDIELLLKLISEKTEFNKSNYMHLKMLLSISVSFAEKRVLATNFFKQKNYTCVGKNHSNFKSEVLE